MLINVELDTWQLSQPMGQWAEEQWAAFCSLWPLAPSERPKDHWGVPSGPARLSVEEATGLAAMGIKLKIVPLPGAMVVKQTDTGRNWSHGEEPAPADFLTGAAVQVTVADSALLMIDEVIHRDDCCTDEIQAMLDEGWRIIAVCPPNAQRRPDYILGRRMTPEQRKDRRR